MPIPGTRKLVRLEENLAAADVDLSSDNLQQLDAVPITVPCREDLHHILGRLTDLCWEAWQIKTVNSNGLWFHRPLHPASGQRGDLPQPPA